MKNIGHFSARVSPTPLMPHAVHAGLRRACHRFSTFSLIAAAALTLAACVSNVPAPVEGRGGYATGTPAGEAYYTVQSGDTLYSIARAHNMDPRELIALNQLENANQLSVGRIIRLRPQGAETPVVDAATGVETQPITDNQGIEQRALGGTGTDSAAGGAVFSGSDAGGSTGLLKREPKAGKEPYSEQALAQAEGPALPRTPDATTAAAATTAAGAAQSAEGGRQGADSAADTTAHGQSWSWPASGAVLGHFGNGNKGVDVSGKHGDPVIAAQDGKVIIANNALRGYGNMVIIKHADNLVSVYAHNSKLLVKEGQQVSKGQKIAEMGNTDADRVKLHFEIRTQGRPVDPMKYLPAR
ncbi:peptidoglycan DD-metalloendopeptidase family protein [Dentiradicibacter hellwigii]|uniref:Peptidoglycan DD-metalloendopeptidase family protein n=1 Tax=Dentiradicibacter hellwigii TaxID=3149053 RepID=A0ABV4UBZ3_9RHOO